MMTTSPLVSLSFKSPSLAHALRNVLTDLWLECLISMTLISRSNSTSYVASVNHVEYSPSTPFGPEICAGRAGRTKCDQKFDADIGNNEGG